ARVALETAELLARARFPQAQRPVLAPGDRRLAIGREGGTGERGAMTPDRADFAPGGQVPDADQGALWIAVAHAGQALAVGRERLEGHPGAGAVFEAAELPGPGGVPQPQLSAGSGRDQQFAVWGKEEALVALARAPPDVLAAGQILQEGDSIGVPVAPRRQGLEVGGDDPLVAQAFEAAEGGSRGHVPEVNRSGEG